MGEKNRQLKPTEFSSVMDGTTDLHGVSSVKDQPLRIGNPLQEESLITLLRVHCILSEYDEMN